MLEVSNLEKTYKNVRAVSGVSFVVERGSASLLLGPNGAGKTTIIRCIMGLLRFKGQIRVGGFDVSADGEKTRSGIGYVPQELSLYDSLSVQEEARFVARLKGAKEQEIPERLRQVDLWEVRQRRVRFLSHGMRQRLGMALALLNDPALLIFDEPINNVDLKGQLEFRSLVRQLSQAGKTLLIATHLSGLSELAGNAVVIDRGRIMATGSPKDLLLRMNAKDTLFVKVGGSNEGIASRIITETIGQSVEHKDGWLVCPVTSEEKIKVVQALATSGCQVEDVIIEPTTVESEYLRLLGQQP